MRAAFLSMTLVTLAGAAGCGDLKVDESLACIGAIDDEYPANTALPVIVVVEASPAEVRQFHCEVETSGEFELTVHAKWRERDKNDQDDDGPELEIDCGKTPELATGTWTLVHGENSEEFMIPTLAESDQQPGPREDFQTEKGGQRDEAALPVCVVGF